MLLYNSTEQTYYDILSVREDASYEEIRGCYRSAILNSHPDKLQDTELESGDRFLKIQKAWETLSDPRSRAVYDSELRASRQDTATAEDLSLKDMSIEDDVEAVELFYQCRCGDYFSVDSCELGEMGYAMSRDGSKIHLQAPDALPASFVLPCGSCSLKVRLLIDADTAIVISDQL